jgi:small basic protein (TIGR04137 family)
MHPFNTDFDAPDRWEDVISSRSEAGKSGISESDAVTIDKSLKSKGRLIRSRNVLKRGERIAKMQEDDRWDDGRSPFGLPKTRVMKSAIGKKKKKKEAEAEGEEEKKE